jgi:hypothetical protein
MVMKIVEKDHGQSCTQIPGHLLADLDPNGTVRLVFFATVGDGDETPLTVKSLDAAEIVFLACGLPPERLIRMRAELERSKTSSVETSIYDSVAAKFRRAGP